MSDTIKYRVIDYELPIIQGTYLTQIGELVKSDDRGVWLKFSDGETVHYSKYLVERIDLIQS